MTVRVKICGVTTKPILTAALDAGAEYIGFVFYPKSPRHISLDDATELNKHIKTHPHSKAQSVALVVNPTNQALRHIIEQVDPDIIQLHGQETPQRVKEIKALTKKPLIKALGVQMPHDIEYASAYRNHTDLILFDAKPPKSDITALPGGNGITFDWSLLSTVADDMNFMLSGGLTPDNVTEAIKQTSPYAVDVSSGVETQPGKKDVTLVQSFIKTAKSAT